MSDHALRDVRAGAPARAAGRPSWAAVAWRQYRLERRMFWRNPSAAFFNLALPLLLLALFGAVMSGNQHDLDIIVPGIAAMSIVSATFVALAHNVVGWRERGLLKRLRGTPMPSSAYLVAMIGHAVTNAAIQLAAVIVAGKLVFGVQWPEDWLSLAVFTVAGVATFACLGVALAHVIPNLDSAPAWINAIFLPLIGISGVFYDVDHVPAALRGIAEALPLVHLIDGMSGAWLRGEGIGSHWDALLVLAAWGVAGLVLAVRGFSWEARRA